MLGLYGTAIGAGVLPADQRRRRWSVAAGGHADPGPAADLLRPPWLTRFVLSGATRDGDITEVVEEHFGKTAASSSPLLYFFAIYPILLMYSVAITNTVESLMVHQLGMTAPPRAILPWC